MQVFLFYPIQLRWKHLSTKISIQKKVYKSLNFFQHTSKILKRVKKQALLKNKRMETNNEQMVEAKAPIRTNQNQEKKADSAFYVSSEIFQYMNPETLVNLIADLYSREVQQAENKPYQELKNIVSLVNAIKRLDDFCGIEESMESILLTCLEFYELETTELDKIVLKIMANEEETLSFNSYLNKAKDFIIENTCLKLLR